MKRITNQAHRGRSGGSRGFTLVEMLLVLTILAALAALIYPRITNRIEESHRTTTRTQIALIQQALGLYEVDNGALPTSRAGLMVLVQRPANTPNWHGPYIEQIPKDHWGNDYVYVCPGKHRPGSFDLMSAGPDCQLGTEDDITNWQEPKRQ